MSSSEKVSPRQIVQEMFEKDLFGQQLGIELADVGEGFCKLRCTLTDEMLNSYNIAHGGVLFSIADSAIAYAAATHGRISVAIDHNISFLKKSHSGDLLFVTAETIHMGYKTGVLQARITNQDDELIAVVKGTVYRKS